MRYLVRYWLDPFNEKGQYYQGEKYFAKLRDATDWAHSYISDRWVIIDMEGKITSIHSSQGWS